MGHWKCSPNPIPKDVYPGTYCTVKSHKLLDMSRSTLKMYYKLDLKKKKKFIVCGELGVHNWIRMSFLKSKIRQKNVCKNAL